MFCPRAVEVLSNDRWTGRFVIRQGRQCSVFCTDCEVIGWNVEEREDNGQQCRSSQGANVGRLPLRCFYCNQQFQYRWASSIYMLLLLISGYKDMRFRESHNYVKRSISLVIVIKCFCSTVDVKTLYCNIDQEMWTMELKHWSSVVRNVLWRQNIYCGSTSALDWNSLPSDIRPLTCPVVSLGQRSHQTFLRGMATAQCELCELCLTSTLTYLLTYLCQVWCSNMMLAVHGIEPGIILKRCITV